MKDKRYIRDFTPIERDVTDNVITFSVASSEPYERLDDNGNPYLEVLAISEDAIDFTRLIDARCPFLFEHDWNRQIGVVEKAWISNDKLYVQVRFSDNFEAQEVVNDILAGIRRNVSIGYIVEDVRKEASAQGIPTWLITRWLPYECSTVSCPADPTVGYQRSLKNKEKDMKNTKKRTVSLELSDEEVKKLKAILGDAEEEKTDEATEAAEDAAEEAVAEVAEEKPAEEETKQEEEVKQEEEKPAEAKEKACDGEDEEKREVCPECGQDPCICETKAEEEAEEIISLGDIVGEISLAKEYVKNKRSLASFKSALKDKKEKKELKPMNNKKFSLRKLIAAEAKLMPADSVEFERSIIEENKRTFNDTQHDIIITNKQLRAFDGTEALNQPEYRPDLYTTNLRPPVTIDAIGLSKVAVTGRDVDFTVAVSGLNAAYGDLNAALTSSAMAFEKRTISPKNEGAYVEISHKSLLQDDPSADAIVTDDIIKALDEQRDKAFWNGLSGNNEPVGLLNIAGVNEVELPATPTLSTALEFEKKIRESYDYAADLKWVMGTAAYYKWASTPYYSNAENRMLIEDRKCIGYDVFVDPSLPTSAVVLGNFAEAFEADFSPISLTVDYLGELALRKAVRVIAWQDNDFCFRRPKSFTKSI